MHKLDEVLEMIWVERQRQLELPGSELDVANSPGDWIAMVSHYVSSEAMRNGLAPDAEAFETSLVKAAAVICAALEYTESMKSRKQLF